MKWEKLLEDSAYWSKWLLVGFCLGNTYMSIPTMSVFNTALVVGSSAILVANWVFKNRK
jgi:hypothetical protein